MAQNTGNPQQQAETLTVYGADWCPDVRRSRKLLDAQGERYVYVNLDHDKPAEALVRRLQGGKRRIPTLVWPDGAFIVEPTDEQLSEYLNSQAADWRQ
ncbi:glutaredoxin family protein [Arthrobacter sp. TB 23]|uniref:glutaredoxin family protein n=1 Tax=Arthrobacter sp. TB 23 TaxID=494419 RepID=UPI0002DA0A03|nr:glutaredoxin domain-containing protein [Arthrobacter sp. TB 23]